MTTFPGGCVIRHTTLDRVALPERLPLLAMPDRHKPIARLTQPLLSPTVSTSFRSALSDPCLLCHFELLTRACSTAAGHGSCPNSSWPRREGILAQSLAQSTRRRINAENTFPKIQFRATFARARTVEMRRQDRHCTATTRTISRGSKEPPALSTNNAAMHVDDGLRGLSR